MSIKEIFDRDKQLSEFCNNAVAFSRLEMPHI